LFDPGATHSFISYACMKSLGLKPETIDSSFGIETPVGTTVQSTSLCRACVIRINDFELEADLIVLKLSKYDVILGMDWLYHHRALMDCYLKKLTLFLPSGEQLQFVGERNRALPFFYSRKGFRRVQAEGFLNSLAASELEDSPQVDIQELLVVKRFLDIFPDELPGLP
ncbi:hypothetical protein HGI15_22645, partial [Modestobacter lapidis]|nr:hypothetical protein [Modestobacter lapidis]